MVESDRRIFDKGETGCFLQDHPGFGIVTSIPPQVALDWAKKECPDSLIGTSGIAAKDINDPDDWHDKCFVVIEINFERTIVLYKWDEKFTIRDRVDNET